MTCIIGLVHENKVWLAGDRAGVDGWRNHTRKHPKVFRKGDMILGSCGSHCVAQIVEYELELPPHNDAKSDIQYLATDFTNAVRDLLSNRNVLTKSQDNEDKFEGGFLIGYRHELYRLSNNFQIDHFTRAFDAIGSGAPFALGAMLCLNTLPPAKRLEAAIQVSSELCCDVSRECDMLSEI